MTDTITPSTDAVPDARTYQWYADGQWRDASGVFDDFEPYTGSLYAHAPNCGPEEAKIAIATANAAVPRVGDNPPAEKARLFFKAAEIVRRRRAEIPARETGSTISFSTFQQDLVAATVEQAANSVYLPKGGVLVSNLPNTHAIRRPASARRGRQLHAVERGQVLSRRAVLNPLAAGRTVVVKPSEYRGRCRRRQPGRIWVAFHDPRRRHVQGLRAGAEDPARHRQRQLTDRER
jgi:acyl-CoA reductase-like NAD-dependent aldehyde dehydrogenase